MHAIRRSQDRGHFSLDWLNSRHSFSFGQYYDPRFMGFGPLRVINEDIIKGGSGFSAHPHENMEILSYVIKGGLYHKDSKGNHALIQPGDIQRMTAGTGIIHSEHNSSETEDTHFLQIWIMPDAKGLAPGYEQRTYPAVDRQNQMKLVGSRDGRGGSVTIHQDVSLYASLLDAGVALSQPIGPGRGLWMQLIKGVVDIGGVRITAGDALAVRDQNYLDIQGVEPAEILVIDVPVPA